MISATSPVAVVALEGAYDVFTHETIDSLAPPAVVRVLQALPDTVGTRVVEGKIVQRPLVDVVATPEGEVVDIRINLESIGYFAVRTFCLSSTVKPPALLSYFCLGDLELVQFVDDHPVYILPLFGDEV